MEYQFKNSGFTFTEEEFMERVSPYGRNGQSMPRGVIHKNKRTVAVTKHQRYRDKLISNGRCPHCGKPCAPYYECPERRGAKLFSRYLRMLVKSGEVEVVRVMKNRKNIYRKIDQVLTQNNEAV